MEEHSKDSGAGSAAYRDLISKFLDPRMTAEHVFSGGGICMSNAIRSMVPGLRCAGRALTVRTLPGFTRRPLEALAMAGRGDVLIIAAGGEAEVSPWGGIVSWDAARKGLAGVVIDGMTRDLVEIRSLNPPLPLFARGQTPAIAGFGTPGTGSIGEPVICGGAQVRTGDLIYGDDDGVVVVPWEQVEGVLELALKSIVFDDKEMLWMESGRSVYDLISMLWDPDGTTYKERKFRWADTYSPDK